MKIKTAFHKGDSVNEKSNLFRNILKNTDNRIELIHGFIGIDKLSELFKNSDCCVLPFLDGLSNKRSSFFNALAFGLPVISVRTSKTSEDTKNKNFIRLIKDPTPSKLAREIIYIYKLKQKNILNRADIFNFFENNYSWNKIVVSVIKFYGETKVATSK